MKCRENAIFTVQLKIELSKTQFSRLIYLIPHKLPANSSFACSYVFGNPSNMKPWNDEDFLKTNYYVLETARSEKLCFHVII